MRKLILAISIWLLAVSFINGQAIGSSVKTAVKYIGMLRNNYTALLHRPILYGSLQVQTAITPGLILPSHI